MQPSLPSNSRALHNPKVKSINHLCKRVSIRSALSEVLTGQQIYTSAPSIYYVNKKMNETRTLPVRTLYSAMLGSCPISRQSGKIRSILRRLQLEGMQVFLILLAQRNGRCFYLRPQLLLVTKKCCNFFLPLKSSCLTFTLADSRTGNTIWHI